MEHKQHLPGTLAHLTMDTDIQKLIEPTSSSAFSLGNSACGVLPCPPCDWQLNKGTANPFASSGPIEQRFDRQLRERPVGLMEIQYRNNRGDFKAYYEVVWKNQKASQRNEYYYGVYWYLAVLGLAIFIAAKHGEMFAICVFAVLALFHIRQTWSFARQWNARADEYAEMMPESISNLTFAESGVTERFSGVELKVPWSGLDSYSVDKERLFIRFLKSRSFIVPFRDLSVVQRDRLLETLEKHNVTKKA